MRLSSKLWSSVSAKSTLTGIAIAIGVAAFAFTGIGRIGGGLDANVAAKVGNQTIGMRQLSEAVQQLDSRSGNDEARRQANLQNALNQLIQEKIFIEEANRLGWSATDLEVAGWLRQVPAFQNKTTKQFDKKLYSEFIKNGQFSELELFRNGRESIASRKYYAALTLPDVLPQPLVEQLAARNGTEFVLEYADVVPTEASVKAASAAEAKKFAEDPANEPKLKQAYDTNKADFSRNAQVKVKSVLIGFKGAERAQGAAAERSEADAQKLAESVRERAAKGEDFSKLSTQSNDDPVAKSQGGDIGFIDDTNIDPETAKAAFALNAQTPVSGVVKTKFGFRVLKFSETRAALNREFADVKVELASRQVSLSIRDKMARELETNLDAALKAKDASKVAALFAQNSLGWKKVSKPVTVESRFIEELGLADPLLKEVFLLKAPGDTTPNVIDFAGRKAVFKLVSRKEGTKPDATKMKGLTRIENNAFAQAFVTGSQKKLFDVYSRDKEIKRNATLVTR